MSLKEAHSSWFQVSDGSVVSRASVSSQWGKSGARGEDSGISSTLSSTPPSAARTHSP